MRRDDWLRLDDAALLEGCREERYRASGPGGQRRNKVETAIRFTHRPTGIVAQATESRSLEENRRRAIRRLRLRLALELREPLDLDRPLAFSLDVNRRNPQYPRVVAVALDALAAADGSYARAARALGVTTSRLLRFLQSDEEVQRAVERLRAMKTAAP